MDSNSKNKISMNSNKVSFNSNKIPKMASIPMLSIKEIVITSSQLGIPWLVLLILCAIIIFI